MSSDSSSDVSASEMTTRRRLLALGGAGGAAGLATLLSQDQARAGHGGTNVFHLGENNTNPAGATTVLNANGARAFDVEGGVSIGSGPDGLALLVRGRSAFSTAGAAAVSAGQESVFVENPAVSGESHISVTLTSDPGDRGVKWVEQDPGSGFTVHLTNAPPPKRPETSLSYLVVEPFDEV